METIQFIGVNPAEFREQMVNEIIEKLNRVPDQWLSQKEAAQYINKTVCTLINWEKSNKINPNRAMGNPRYLKSQLEPFKK
jgi:DNA-binding transcriptional regulator YiaG